VVASCVYNEASEGAIILTVLMVIASAALVGDAPRLRWEYVAGYVAGVLIWMPWYWYLRLSANRRGLVEYLSQRRDPKSDYCSYGKRVDGKWLPNHPDAEDIAANGLVWFVAAPVYLSRDSIRVVIERLRIAMNRVQASMAIQETREKEDDA
jgi:hypothetical protein